MKEIIKFGVILGVVYVMTAGFLAGLDSLTNRKIIPYAQAEELLDLKDVLPEAIHFEAVKKGEDIFYYKAIDKEGKLIGAVFKAVGRGYSSNIQTIAGMLKDGSINAIKVLSQDETPGLGARVAEPEFTDRFRHIHDLSRVQAVTGATISSLGVIESVKKKAEEIRELIKE